MGSVISLDDEKQSEQSAMGELDFKEIGFVFTTSGSDGTSTPPYPHVCGYGGLGRIMGGTGGQNRPKSGKLSDL